MTPHAPLNFRFTHLRAIPFFKSGLTIFYNDKRKIVCDRINTIKYILNDNMIKEYLA